MIGINLVKRSIWPTAKKVALRREKKNTHTDGGGPSAQYKVKVHSSYIAPFFSVFALSLRSVKGKGEATTGLYIPLRGSHTSFSRRLALGHSTLLFDYAFQSRFTTHFARTSVAVAEAAPMN